MTVVNKENQQRIKYNQMLTKISYLNKDLEKLKEGSSDYRNKAKEI